MSDFIYPRRNPSRWVAPKPPIPRSFHVEGDPSTVELAPPAAEPKIVIQLIDHSQTLPTNVAVLERVGERTITAQVSANGLLYRCSEDVGATRLMLEDKLVSEGLTPGSVTMGAALNRLLTQPRGWQVAVQIVLQRMRAKADAVYAAQGRPIYGTAFDRAYTPPISLR